MKPSQNRPKNVRTSSKIRRKSVPEGPKTVQVASPRPSQLRVSAQKRPKRVPVSPGAGSGGPKRRISGDLGSPGGRPGRPKSVENRKKSFPGGVRFSIRFGTSVLIDFGRVFGSKMGSKIDDFSTRRRKAQLRKSIDFPWVFLRF